MSKKDKIKHLHEIVVPRNQDATISPQMYKWLKENGAKDNDPLAWHDKLFVQCVKELQPDKFRIQYVEGNEYLMLHTANDTIVLTPKDLRELKKNFIKIDEES